MKDFKNFCLSKYSQDFHKRHITSSVFDYQEEFGKRLCETFSITSVIDFGCGVAKSLYGAYKMGVRPIKGLEISLQNAMPYINKEITNYIFDEDASLPSFNTSTKYDCAWSFEVAEHLNPDSSEQFVKNMTSVSERLIIFTAAPPGQKGIGHINCKPKEYWIRLFKQNKFKVNNDDIKKTLDAINDLNVPDYIINNMLVFRKL